MTFFYYLYTFTNTYKTDMNDFDSLTARACFYTHAPESELQVYGTFSFPATIFWFRLCDSENSLRTRNSWMYTKSMQVSLNRCYFKNQFNISKFRSKGLQLIFLEQVLERFFARLSLYLYIYFSYSTSIKVCFQI